MQDFTLNSMEWWKYVYKLSVQYVFINKGVHVFSFIGGTAPLRLPLVHIEMLMQYNLKIHTVTGLPIYIFKGLFSTTCSFPGKLNIH